MTYTVQHREIEAHRNLHCSNCPKVFTGATSYDDADAHVLETGHPVIITSTRQAQIIRVPR